MATAEREATTVKLNQVLDDAKSWGGVIPVYDSQYRKVAYDGAFTGLTINTQYYRLVVEKLGLSENVLNFTFHGYKEYECKNDYCEVETVYLPVVNCGVYHPYTSQKHISRVIAQTMLELDAIQRISGFDYLIAVDLTCPRDISERYFDPNVMRRFKASVREFLKILGKLLFPDHNSQLGAYGWIHIWATHNPTKPHLHIHLLIPNVAYNRKTKRLYRFAPMIKHNLLRFAWREAMRRYGLLNPVDYGKVNCYIHYAKYENRPQVVHHIGYRARRGLVDLNEHLTVAHLEQDINVAFVRHLLRYTPRRQRFGWLTNLKRFRIYRTPPPSDDCQGDGQDYIICRKTENPPCPFCGHEMVYRDFHRSNLPDIPHIIRYRGEFKRLEAPPFPPFPEQPDKNR